MSVLRRVEKLEDVAGADSDVCGCQQRIDVRFYPGEDSKRDADADTRPGEVCAFCGRPRTIIKVVYASSNRAGGFSFKEDERNIKTIEGVSWEDV